MQACPGGAVFRRAVPGDAAAVSALAAQCAGVFSVLGVPGVPGVLGAHHVGALIELSTLSICMADGRRQLAGFVCLCDHPGVPGVAPAHWEPWLRNVFQKYYLASDTLFVHFMCCADAVADIFLEEAFASVFRNDAYLLNIVLVVPPDYPREEDNDDIVKLLGSKCKRLEEEYGDYYISEIIGRHPGTNRKIIVADYQDHAVGVMCLNTEINYDMLSRTYDLNPFHGLRKVSALEREEYRRKNLLLKTFGYPIMLGKWSPFRESTRSDLVNYEVNSKNLTKKREKSTSKVNFDPKSAMRLSFEHFYFPNTSEDFSEKEINSSTSSVATNPSFTNYFLEEDAFEYDIVNIDKTLLTVPEGLSCELLPRTSSMYYGPANKNKCESTRPKKIKIRNKARIERPETQIDTDEAVTKYSGEPNAFVIELFGLRDDIDDRQAINLLEAAFEVMKDYDYCIIQVPCMELSFSLLQHFCFVPTREKSNSKCSLYVAHRNSVLGKLRARRAEAMDLPQVSQLLGSLDGKETIWTVENTILNKNKLQCYVFFSGISLIGIGILEQPEQIDFMRSEFNLDSHRIHEYHAQEGLNCGLSTLRALLAYSVFSPHWRWFARELLRLAGAAALLWLSAARHCWVTHKANSLAGAMIPLMPRTTEIDCVSVPELRRIRNLSKTVMAFSSWFISKKLTSIPRANIDVRIVVVGASRTAMAFLNSLIFSDSCTYLFFTSVTLVSPDGLPYARRTNAISEMMFEKYRTYSDKYLKSTPYTYYVNIVRGHVVEINKQQKYITVSSGGTCYYDLLFLLFGKQYQHPDYLKDVLNEEKLKRNREIPLYTSLGTPQFDSEPIISNFTPANVFIVNTIFDANRALKFVKAFTWQDDDYQILVYGASKHVYCCLAALTELKIPSKNIVFIEPFPPSDPRKSRVSLFCNAYVDKSVREMINSLNITVYRSYYFQRWQMDVNNLVTHVEFLSHLKLLKLKCSALFYYGIRGVNEQAFIAINKSGMAYDGGILIDHEFKTKDPFIYAAGPVTRYYRKYNASNKRQKYYDSYEVGMTLGSQIRDKFDPLFREFKDPEKPLRSGFKSVSTDAAVPGYGAGIATPSLNSYGSRDSREVEVYPDVPQFVKPLVFHCTLPGGLQYLEVRSPGKKIPHYFVQSLQYNGHVMETFKNGYFKLHLTNELVVDAITCLSLENYSLDNFKNLYGLSSTILNNVYLRYKTKKLDNFFDFFRAPWAFFLYHEQSDELFAMVKELIPKGHAETLAEAMRTIGESLSDESCKLNTNIKIRSNFEKSPYFEAITDYVIKWLSENDVLFPMYLQPRQSWRYHHHTDQHPVFKKRKRTLAKMLLKIF